MSHPHRPQRLMAMLAVVGIASGGALAMPSIARADGEGWRDGWCREGEGQTVVVDWSQTVEVPPEEPAQLIRCIKLESDGGYPAEGSTPQAQALRSAGIDFVEDMGKFITSINEIPEAGEYKWHFVGGEVTEDGSNWLGSGSWKPDPEVNSFLGVALTDEPDTSLANPVPEPQFDPSKPTPTPTATATATPTATKTPSPSPSASASGTATSSGTGSPSTSASSSATRTPTVPPATKTPTTTAPVAQTPASATSSSTASSTQRPSRTRRTTRPPRRTSRPQRPTNRPQPPVNPPAPPPPPAQNNPEPPPVEEPISAPPEDASGQATNATNPRPSRVWGREDATRQSSEATRSEAPAPWSQLAAVAGAVVIVGGLGTAFARGLQTSTPPVVEEE